MPKKNGDRVLMGVVKNNIILDVYGLGCFLCFSKYKFYKWCNDKLKHKYIKLLKFNFSFKKRVRYFDFIIL